jgi:hypothetical protein
MPIVVEVVPWAGPVDGSSTLGASWVRGEGDWLLCKPYQFWKQDEIWGKIPLRECPDLANTVEAIDWAADLAALLGHRESPIPRDDELGRQNRNALASHPKFAKFWLSLSDVQKARALGTGISRRDLRPDAAELLTSAAIVSCTD